ncbi:MAG: hypothetical protein IKL85_02090, partial [Lentisphaeria bacterium]|nr:hypothetical protein [Lentisphaeria bacterium]
LTPDHLIKLCRTRIFNKRKMADDMMPDYCGLARSAARKESPDDRVLPRKRSDFFGNSLKIPLERVYYQKIIF